MEIIYQSESYIVCIKPAGVISESNGQNGFPDLIENELTKKVYTVHRLDKAVSGVMVYALSQKAAADISDQIQKNIMKKQYVALVHNVPKEKIGVMKDLLFKDKVKNKAFIVKRERKGVKKAELDYEVIEEREIENEKVSVVKVNLHTGRFHQIRVQFASRNMPIVGDKRYGAKDNCKNIMLYSTKLEFVDPDTGEHVIYRHTPQWMFI